jgi:hypothetical protein
VRVRLCDARDTTLSDCAIELHGFDLVWMVGNREIELYGRCWMGCGGLGLARVYEGSFVCGSLEATGSS